MSASDRELRYFAYGSNLDAEQMSERCPSSRALFRARLDGYRLDFTHLSRRWGGGAADVVLHSGEWVWGVVYALDADEVALLDRFESGYHRLHLPVRDEDQRLGRLTAPEHGLDGPNQPVVEGPCRCSIFTRSPRLE